MSKGLISVDSKEIVSYFYKAIKKQTDGQFGRHVVSVKRLLLEGYSKEEIMHVIDMAAKNPPAGGIYSFGFISYDFATKIAPYRKQKAAIIAKKAMDENKDFGSLPMASNAGSKLERFGSRKELDWDG